MEYSPQIKLIPHSKKSQIQQSLFKDSPKNNLLSQRKFTKHISVPSCTQLERNLKSTECKTQRLTPLQQRDLNKQETPKLTISNTDSNSKSSDAQQTLLQLWKFNKLGGEIPEQLISDVQKLYYDLKTKKHCFKSLRFLNELNTALTKQRTFPECLSPYLEEILCSTNLNFPLITENLSLLEAEAFLFVSICRFSKKKIEVIVRQFLRKITTPSDDLLNAVYVLLLALSEVDEKLELNLKSQKGKYWELFVEYSSNPGQVIQNIRKIPNLIRKNMFSQKTSLLIQSHFMKTQKLETCTELFNLVSEMISFFKIIEKTPFMKGNRLKRIVNISSSNTSRSGTPATCRIITSKKIKHTRSASKDFFIKKHSVEQEKNIQFMQESRYHKRIIDKLASLIGDKMKADPDYLAEVKDRDYGQYVQFKSEYIDVHKDYWTEESIKNLVETDLRISEDESLKFADVKKDAFFSFVLNRSLLSSLVGKVKASIMTACK